MAHSKAVRNIDAEIVAVSARLAATERTGPTLAEREAERTAALQRAVVAFQTLGLPLHGQGALSLQQLLEVLCGAVLAGPEKVTEAELQRVRDQFRQSGSRGLTQPDKLRQLTELRGKLRQLQAEKVLASKEAGQHLEPTAADADDVGLAEMLLHSASDLRAIVNGKEA